MEHFEAEILLKAYNSKYKEEKEWTRFLKYLDAKMQGAKISKPESLFRFPWEKSEVKRSKKELQEAAQKMAERLMQDKTKQDE